MTLFLIYIYQWLIFHVSTTIHIIGMALSWITSVDSCTRFCRFQGKLTLIVRYTVSCCSSRFSVWTCMCHDEAGGLLSLCSLPSLTHHIETITLYSFMLYAFYDFVAYCYCFSQNGAWVALHPVTPESLRIIHKQLVCVFCNTALIIFPQECFFLLDKS